VYELKWNLFDANYIVGRDRGAGAQENRGREGYRRRERKGWEAEEKCETLFSFLN